MSVAKAVSPQDILSDSMFQMADNQNDISQEEGVTELEQANAQEVSQPVNNQEPTKVAEQAPNEDQDGKPTLRKASLFNRVKNTQGSQPAASSAPQQNLPEKPKVTTPAPAEKPKARLRDVVVKREKAQADGLDAKILLATLKVYSPLVSAATHKPGRSANNTEIADAMARLSGETDRLAKVICEEAKIDPLDPENQWVVSQARQIAASHVAHQWRRTSDHENFKADDYRDAISELVKLEATQPDKMSFPYMTDTVRLYLSITKSLVPVIREYSLFENVMASMFTDYRIDRTKIFLRAAEIIQEKSTHIVDYLGIKNSDEAGLIAYQSMLNHCGEIMACSVAYACDRQLDAFDRMSSEERNAIYQESQKSGNPLVIDLVAMENDFSDNVNALAEIAKNSPKIYTLQIKP